MTFRSDCRQASILFLTSDASPTSSSSIVTCVFLPACRICPREQNEKLHEKYAQTNRTVSETVSPEYSGSSLGFLQRNTLPGPCRPSIAERADILDEPRSNVAPRPTRPSR